MMKIMCDICGKDITSTTNLTDGKTYKYCITVYGTQLDMCKECRKDLYNWIEKHKTESEDK